MATTQKSSRPVCSFHRTKRGTSLLISVGLVSIITLVSIGVSTVVVSSIRSSAQVTRASEAFYAAEGALEKGLLANAQAGTGFNSGGPQPVMYPSPECDDSSNGQAAPDGSQAGQSGSQAGCGNSPLKATYQIQGQIASGSAGKIGNFYVIPGPGTGSVGKNCNPLNPVLSGKFPYSYFDYVGGVLTVQTAQGDAIDHPCNWNKIHVGQSVTIPLYYVDVNGNIVNLFSPYDSNKTFELKIRAACEYGQEMCPEMLRETLDNVSGNPGYNGDDPIVSWQIIAQDAVSNGTRVLLPNLNYNPVQQKWALSSSIVTESKINLAKPPSPLYYKVLSQANLGEDEFGCRSSIINFLTSGDSSGDCPDTPNWNSYNLIKPELKFSVIHSLDSGNIQNIPYLEYQILTDATLPPPSDANQTITAEGYSGTFKQVLQVKKPHAGSTVEYVIQQ